MAEIIIDGRAIPAAPGQTVLEAALAAGFFIPHLCHHPDLTPAGQCRLCLVEQADGRLTASCQLAAEDGLRVKTDTADVQEARQMALHLILSAHPLNCMGCAASGQCRLQEVAAFIGIDPEMVSRLHHTESPRPMDNSNPFFTFDPGRCVLCGICVRTCDELQGLGAIDTAYSGGATAIATCGDRPMAESRCESCGECVVRCPTGALMARDPRPASREVKTVCSYCGTGCSVYLGVRGSQVVSARGDGASPVNNGQLCVKGRFGSGFINSPERLTTPLIRRGDTLEPASWDEALDLVARRLTEFRGETSACIGSSRCTNEDVYVTQKFARAVMQTPHVDNCARLCHAPTVTGLKRALGTGGGTSPIAELDGAACIFVIGSNTTVAHPVVGARIRRAARHTRLIVADPREVDLAARADVHLQLQPGTDVALLLGMAHVILAEGLQDQAFIDERCEGFEAFAEIARGTDLAWAAGVTGVPAERIAAAARMFATHSPAMIVYSLGITEHSHGTDNVLSLANLAMLTGNVGKPSAGVMPMRGQNNVQGACDMGCVPDLLPGGLAVRDAAMREQVGAAWGAEIPAGPGLTIMEMLDAARAGTVKALYIVGMDPAFTASDTHCTQDALRAAEFVVVQDIFLSGTAKFADVVLPAASFAEKSGTFTNLERRVQLVRPAISPPGEARADWQIVCDIARRMGAEGFDFASPAEIMDEIAAVAPPFGGFSHARLEEHGIQWPCPSAEHAGTPRLHVGRFGTPSGRGQFTPLAYRPPAEVATAEYPFILTTGRSVYHYHLAMTSQVDGLMELEPEDRVWMHPQDGADGGIADGDRVRVESRRGELTVRAQMTDAVMPGTAFMTFHIYGTPTNVLTNSALDPVAKTPEFKVTAVSIRPE